MSPTFHTSRRERPWRQAFASGAILAAAGALAYQRMQRARRRARAPRSVLDASGAVTVRRSITIRATPAELYRRWRKLDELPRILRHLQSVTESSSVASHWVAAGPGGTRVEWDADIVEDVPDERLAWKTCDDAHGQPSIAHAGSVRFRPAPNDRGTELRVELAYDAPGGALSTAVAKLFGGDPDTEIREDLRQFKQWVEAGEITTAERRPEGGQ